VGLLLIGLVAGAAVGAIGMAFLGIAAYDRGYADAWRRRNEWRLELAVRRGAADHKIRSAA
jgi:hypothetical protein